MELVRIVGLTIANGSDGIEALSNSEIVDSVISVPGVALKIGPATSGLAPDVHVSRTTMMSGEVGVWVAAGTGSLEDCTIEDFSVGARVDQGKLSLDRSWVRDATTVGVESFGGRVEIASSLVTDSGPGCVRIRSGGTAVIDFATITACGVGIDLENFDANALSLRRSIIYGNSSNDLQGVDCSQMARSATESECCGQNGNLCVDPGFLDPSARDYRLPVDSPCVGAALEPADFDGRPCKDFAGLPRLMDADLDGVARGDIGAFEFDATSGLTPGTIQGVRFSDVDTLIWDVESAAASYNVHSAMLSDLDYFAPWTCAGSATATTFTLAPDDPPPGDGTAFVVEGQAAGGQRGPWARGSCAERSNDPTCP
jgi:hypothetical protein